MNDEGFYGCTSCGEEIVVPLDLIAGSQQEYVDDCPVCCHPNVIHVEIDGAGDVRVWVTRKERVDRRKGLASCRRRRSTY